MLVYSIKQYFTLRRKRWLRCALFLFIFAIILKYIGVEDGIAQNGKFLLVEYIFAVWSYPLNILLVIPILYCYLIGDVFTKDYEDGYIMLFICRTDNRLEYFISKCVVILISTNLFLLIYLLILICVGLIFRMPFSGVYNYPILKCLFEQNGNIFQVLIMNYGLLVMGLTALGIMVSVVSLLLKKAIYSYLILAVLIVEGHNSIFNTHSSLVYSPIGQLVLLLHSPFYFYNNGQILQESLISRIRIFTVSYSIRYLLFIIVLSLIIGWLTIIRVDLTKRA